MVIVRFSQCVYVSTVAHCVILFYYRYTGPTYELLFTYSSPCGWIRLPNDGGIGNVQTITAGSEILRYSYDDRDRLTRACAVSSTSSTCLGGTTFNQSYAYDLHE